MIDSREILTAQVIIPSLPAQKTEIVYHALLASVVS
jgi:hypothetical protein